TIIKSESESNADDDVKHSSTEPEHTSAHLVKIFSKTNPISTDSAHTNIMDSTRFSSSSGEIGADTRVKSSTSESEIETPNNNPSQQEIALNPDLFERLKP